MQHLQLREKEKIVKRKSSSVGYPTFLRQKCLFTSVFWILLLIFTDCCFLIFPRSSHNVYIINYCYFPCPICSMSVAQYSSSYFIFQDISNRCVGYAQYLSIGADRCSFFFSFSLVFMLAYLLKQEMQSLHVKLKAKTKSSHSGLYND